MTVDDFAHYLIVLFGLSGWLMLQFDVKTYTMADMKKERKVSRALGWINLIIAIVVFIANSLFGLLWWWD